MSPMEGQNDFMLQRSTPIANPIVIGHTLDCLGDRHWRILIVCQEPGTWTERTEGGKFALRSVLPAQDMLEAKTPTWTWRRQQKG